MEHFSGEYAVKVRAGGEIKFPAEFLSRSFNQGQNDSVFLTTRPIFSENNKLEPKVICGWHCRKVWEEEIQGGIKEGNYTKSQKGQFATAVEISSDGVIKIPERLLKILDLRNGEDAAWICGVGDHFTIASQHAYEWDRRNSKAWLDDLEKKGIDPLALLDPNHPDREP